MLIKPYLKKKLIIDRAKELLDQNIDLEDAWAQICPETEKERLHCLDLMKD